MKHNFHNPLHFGLNEKRLLTTFILAVLVVNFAVVFFPNFPATVYADWSDPAGLEGWNYRKSHVIEGSGGASANYEVPIKTYFNASEKYFNSWSRSGANPIVDSDNHTWIAMAYNSGTYYMFLGFYENSDIKLYNSTNGVDFTEHPSSPVILRGDAGTWDDYTLEPHSVIYFNGEWRLYYCGRADVGYTWQIGYAYSSDLVSWTKYASNPVLSPTGTEVDVADPQAFVWQGKVWIHYASRPDGSNWDLRVAWSDDGRTFTKSSLNPILETKTTPGNGGFAPGFVYVPDDNEIYGLFKTMDAASDPLIAFHSFDGEHFTYYNDESTVFDGVPAQWDTQIIHVDAVKVGNTWKMYYDGSDGVNVKVGLATATTISTWNTISLEAKSKADFGDVRFTLADGITELKYVMENKVDSDYAFFKVQIPDPTTTQTIYVYYGNSGATTTSSEADTYTAFDGLEADNLNLFDVGTLVNGATIAASTDAAGLHSGSYNVKGAGLNLAGEYVMARRNITSGAIKRAQAWFTLTQDVAVGTAFFGVVSFFGSTSVCTRLLRDAAGTYYWSVQYYNGSAYTYYNSTPVNITLNHPYLLELKAVASTTVGELHLYTDGIGVIHRTAINTGSANFTEVRIEVFQHADFGNANVGTVYWDSFALLNYVAVEPVHGAWGSEEEVPPDQFSLSVGSSGVANVPFLINGSGMGYFSNTSLHVDGNQIKDVYGNVIVLKGTSIMWLSMDADGSWMGDSVWNEAKCVQELTAIKEQGLNAIRFTLSVDLWKNNVAVNGHTHRYIIERVLSVAEQIGLIVYLQPAWVLSSSYYQNELPYPPYQGGDYSSVIANPQEFVDYMVSLSEGTNNHTNLIYSFWNEPRGTNPVLSDYYDVEQQAIDAMRGNGTTQIIAVMGVNWGSPYKNITTGDGDGLEWFASSGISDAQNNIIIDAHNYFGHFTTAGGNAYLKSDLETALSMCHYFEQDIPILLSETGLTYGGSSEEEQYFDNLMTLFDEHGISYMPWAWAREADYGSFPLITAYPDTLTLAGQIVASHTNMSYVTNTTLNFGNGDSINVTVPSSYAFGGDSYSFVSWDDDSTDLTRTITLTANTTITANYEEAPYALSISGTGVSNTTITIDSQAWSATSSGNDTNPSWQIGLFLTNGTQVGSNSTSATGTWTSLTNTTSYIAAFRVEGDNGAWDYTQIMFTYEVINTYTLAISGTGVSNTTITINSQSWSATSSGNDTNPMWQIQLLFAANRSEAVANTSLTTGTWSSLVNTTSYIACFSVAGDNLATDYTEVMFTYQTVTDDTSDYERTKSNLFSNWYVAMGLLIILPIIGAALMLVGIMRSDGDPETIKSAGFGLVGMMIWLVIGIIIVVQLQVAFG